MVDLIKTNQPIYIVNGEPHLTQEAAHNAARRAELMEFWEDHAAYGEVQLDTVIDTCLAKRGDLYTILIKNYESFFKESK